MTALGLRVKSGWATAVVLAGPARAPRVADRHIIVLRDCRAAGHAVRRIMLVVGSDIDPAKIGNDHIRAHALEGRLFRTVLEQAARARRLACSVVVERTVYAEAAVALKRSERELRRAVTELGRPVTGPWRADDKAATLAAWLALR